MKGAAGDAGASVRCWLALQAATLLQFSANVSRKFNPNRDESIQLGLQGQHRYANRRLVEKLQSDRDHVPGFCIQDEQRPMCPARWSSRSASKYPLLFEWVVTGWGKMLTRIGRSARHRGCGTWPGTIPTVMRGPYPYEPGNKHSQVQTPARLAVSRFLGPTMVERSSGVSLWSDHTHGVREWNSQAHPHTGCLAAAYAADSNFRASPTCRPIRGLDGPQLGPACGLPFAGLGTVLGERLINASIALQGLRATFR